mgnify:CR=1 FL=1
MWVAIGIVAVVIVVWMLASNGNFLKAGYPDQTSAPPGSTYGQPTQTALAVDTKIQCGCHCMGPIGPNERIMCAVPWDGDTCRDDIWILQESGKDITDKSKCTAKTKDAIACRGYERGKSTKTTGILKGCDLIATPVQQTAS